MVITKIYSNFVLQIKPHMDTKISKKIEIKKERFKYNSKLKDYLDIKSKNNIIISKKKSPNKDLVIQNYFVIL